MAFILKTKGGTGSSITETVWLYGAASKIGKTGKTTTGNQTSVANLANLSLNLPAFQIPLGDLNCQKRPVTKLETFSAPSLPQSQSTLLVSLTV